MNRLAVAPWLWAALHPRSDHPWIVIVVTAFGIAELVRSAEASGRAQRDQDVIGPATTSPAQVSA